MDEFFKKYTKGQSEGMLKDLASYIQSIENRNEILSKQINSYSKDAEIEKLLNEIDDIRKRSVTILSNKEDEIYKLFRKKHYDKCGRAGAVEVTVLGTGIGDVVSLRCTKCGEIEDITDYGCW